MGFTTGLIFDGVDGETAWRIMIAFGAILPCVMIYLATKVMPESPRWLIANERQEEAREILEAVYPNGERSRQIVMLSGMCVFLYSKVC